MVSLYAERIGTPVYIFHVSGREAMESVRTARASGVEIYAETCTHYLTLDDSVFASDDAWKYVISPPLRSARDREYLWGAIGDGTVTAVGSDHCAYELGLKKVGYDDHREVPAGAPGIEARTPILFASAVQRELGYELFSDISARRAATALGLYPRKGSIQVGADADVVLWDATSEWQGSMLAKSSQSTFALYDSFKGKGRPRHVFSRGNQLVRDGEFLGTRGMGRFIRRQPRQTRVKV
jgi:dihydropyrimidinase